MVNFVSFGHLQTWAAVLLSAGGVFFLLALCLCIKRGSGRPGEKWAALLRSINGFIAFTALLIVIAGSLCFSTQATHFLFRGTVPLWAVYASLGLGAVLLVFSLLGLWGTRNVETNIQRGKTNCILGLYTVVVFILFIAQLAAAAVLLIQSHRIHASMSIVRKGAAWVESDEYKLEKDLVELMQEYPADWVNVQDDFDCCGWDVQFDNRTQNLRTGKMCPNQPNQPQTQQPQTQQPQTQQPQTQQPQTQQPQTQQPQTQQPQTQQPQQSTSAAARKLLVIATTDAASTETTAPASSETTAPAAPAGTTAAPIPNPQTNQPSNHGNVPECRAKVLTAAEKNARVIGAIGVVFAFTQLVAFIAAFALCCCTSKKSSYDDVLLGGSSQTQAYAHLQRDGRPNHGQATSYGTASSYA